LTLQRLLPDFSAYHNSIEAGTALHNHVASTELANIHVPLLLQLPFSFGFIYHFILNVKAANCSALNCSALLLNRPSSSVAVSNKFFTAFLKVFRRWLNAVFTNKKKSFSLFISIFSVLGNKRMILLFTLGGGL